MTTRLYKINGVYNTWQYWHDSCGYSESPSQPMSFKRSDGEHWGENAGDGYALNSDGELSQWSMWSDGIVGWFDANDLAEQGAYPASSADLFVERTGEKAKAVSLDDGTNTYYLIDGYLDLGWRLWEVLEAEGWQISSGGELAYIIVDEDTGEIVFSQNDPGMEFAEVGTLLMPDSEMITVYETGVHTESFYFTTNGRNETQNTNISWRDIPVYNEDGTAPPADTPYADSSVLAFMDVDGNTKQAQGEGLYVNDGVLRLDAPDTDEGEQWSALVEYIEPEPPAPSELTAYFTNAGAAGTSNTRIGGDFGSTPATLYDASGNPLPYDLSKKYTILGMYNYSGGSVEVSSYSILKDTNGIVQYIPGGIRNVFTIVLSLSDQTTIDAYFTSAGASAATDVTCQSSITYTLYDANGNFIPYDSTKTYTTVASFVANGDTAYADFAGNYASYSDTILKGRPSGTNLYYKVVIRVE